MTLAICCVRPWRRVSSICAGRCADRCANRRCTAWKATVSLSWCRASPPARIRCGWPSRSSRKCNSRSIPSAPSITEAAVQRAKRHGGAGLEWHARDMNERAAEWLALETELRHAEEHDELRLYYQPQVEIASGRVIGAEALLRWQHPERGLLVPSQFLAL